MSVALFYFALAVTWILASGAFLSLSVENPVVQQRIELGKGLLFVLVSSISLYLVLRTWGRDDADTKSQERTGFFRRFWQILGLAVVLVTVPLAGIMVVRIQAPQIAKEAFANLDAIADLKASQVRIWLDERNRDASAIAAMPELAERFAALSGESGKGSEEVRRLLLMLVGAGRYDSAALFDNRGKPLLEVGSFFASPDMAAMGREALSSGLPKLGGIFRDSSGNWHLNLVIPVRRVVNGVSENLGIVVLHENPGLSLFSVLSLWPTASRSGEALLFRRVGNEVVFIYEPPHRNKGDDADYSAGTADSTSLFRISADKEQPSNWTSSGLDYRGSMAFAAFRTIAGTDWFVAAKIDRDEVMSPLYDLAFWVSLIVMLAIAMVGAIVLLFLRQRSRAYRLEMAAQTTQLMQQFYDLPFIGIAVASADNNRWIRCNDRFCEIMGYSRDEILNLSWRDVTTPEDMAITEAEIARIRSGVSDGYVLDKRFRRKDGSVVYTRIDVRCVRRGDGTPDKYLAMIHDITEQKAAEARIQRLTRTYAALSECNQSIVRCQNQEGLFSRVCQIAVGPGGMKMAWIGMIDPRSNMIKPVASDGGDADLLKDIEISCDAGSPVGRGAAGTAVRERRPVWVDDFQHDPMTEPWHVRGISAGWVSSCTLPLERNGETVGVFVLYSGERGAFDEIQRALLVEMAADISFALTNLARDEARTEAEAQLGRLTSMYAALSECNQAILRTSSEAELFPQICRFAVEFGHMQLAFIAKVDASGEKVVTVASYGEGTEYVKDLPLSIAPDSPYGSGVVGIAIRERRLVVIQDFLNDSRTEAWRERALRANWRGAAAVPLTCEGEVVGVLEMVSGEANAFDEDVQRLLSEMGLDISFALDLFVREDERRHVEQALRESEERFRDLYEKAPLAYQSLDIAGDIIDVNEAWLHLVGYEYEEVIGRNITEFLSEVSVNRLAEAFSTFRQQGRADGTVFEFVCKDGGVRLLMLNGLISRDKDGNFLRTHCILSDLTERMRSEEQLRLSAKVFEQGGEGVMITDAQASIVMVNRAFEIITGYSQDEAIGKNPRFLSSDRHDREFFRAMWEVINTEGFWQGELWNRRKDGDVYPEYLSISRVVDDSGVVTHYIGTFSDISESKASQEHIQRLAHYDSLTGLPNRSLLADRVSLALSRMERSGETLALIFLDLDRFKNVNDSLGHRIGDELLIQVAQRLKEVLREEDTVSRLGGDEFILVLPGADAEGAAHVAEKVLKVLSRPYQIEQYELAVTPSMGIAMYPSDGDNYDILSKCADTAMYRAKQSGRQTFRFFTREMQDRSDRALQLENALRRALELDQLSLRYQPQVSLESGRIIGVEALLRWRHPDLGEIMPADFIPVAEESGLILPIGEWVLRSAMRQVRDWFDRGMPALVLAVNLSAVQFRQANLPQLVSQILDECRLDPQLLELELTEGVAMENPVEAIAVMNEFHARGVRMSIDDFGTGYSSLSYLKRFKVGKLKIDKSFVRDISRDPEDEAIVEAIISLARSLGMRTVAEGVETAAQSSFLMSKGCNEGQGYLFSKPLLSDDFERFARRSLSSRKRH